MKTRWKVIIISVSAGLVLVILGISLGASLNGFYLNSAGVHIIQYDETKITETALGNVTDIDVDVRFSDVEFVIADTYGFDILAYGDDWTWELENGILRIRQASRATLSFFISSFNIKESRVKVFLPRDAQLGTVSVKTDSGKVNVGGFKADGVQIYNSFGDVDVHAVTGGDMLIDMDSGHFTGTDINAQTFNYNNSFGNGRFEAVQAERLTIGCDSGDLELRDCRTGETDLTNSFGKITATGFYSSKATITADSGDISLDGEFSGETIIRSDFGNVKFSSSKPKEDYSYDLGTDFGRILLDNDKFGGSVSNKSGNPSANSLTIEASSGDIEVYFAK